MKFSRRIDFSASRNGLDLEREELLRQGLLFFDLSQSNPTRTGFEHPAEALADALSARGNTRYTPDPKGLASARSAIAAHLALSGDDVDVDRLLLCASTSEAYSYLFKLLCDPGDSILVPKPGYPLFDHLASLESVQALGYRLEYDHPAGWSIDLSSVQRVLESSNGDRVKAIVLINPNNPTGSYIHERELREIQELCRRHSLAIISDEVFHGYELEPREGRVSLLAQDRYQTPRPVLTFVLDGLSKRLCLPQMKLGWIAVSGPEDEVAGAMEALELISDSFLSVGAPVTNGVGKLLAHEADIRSKVKRRMASNLGAYRKLLEYEGSPHRVLSCEGGWTALVQSPRLAGEEELACGLLRQEGIYVHPGFFFDMEKEAYFAFSLIVEPHDAEAAAWKFRAFFDRYSQISN
ncbi:MAG: pyridoxal phosphate-dependent aminotransferase [Rectinemataceae bacterium]